MNKGFLPVTPVATFRHSSCMLKRLLREMITGSFTPTLKSIKFICLACILIMSLSWSPFSVIAQKNTAASKTTKSKNIPAEGLQARFTIIGAANGTFGYDIYLNDRKYIHQQTIPGVAGKLGFSTRQDAEKVAALVVQKIATGNMPPAVSNAELKKLKIF